MIEGKVHDVSYAAPWVAQDAQVDLRAHLGRWVAVGAGARWAPTPRSMTPSCCPGSTVGEGAKVLRSVLGPEAHVGAAPHSRIRSWARRPRCPPGWS